MGICIGVIAIPIAVYGAFQASPWPGALLVRAVFDHNDKTLLAQLQKHVPATPITVLSNLSYQDGDDRALLDVYMPASITQGNQTLPLVVWTHGGAWVSGDKANVGPYFKQIATRGFIVVSLNYSLAPEKSSPAQVFELNAAHAYLMANADRFHINQNRIFLAGDSAGAQLTSQMATLITNPDYAREFNMNPALEPTQLAGTVLFCGIYQLQGLTEADPTLPKLISWGDDEVVWAFSGTRAKQGPAIYQISPYYHVTANFPPSFISGGNGDPLTDHQSKPLAQRLAALHVPITTLFYPANHQPSLPHEYQFNLDTADGQQALNKTVEFLQTTVQK